MTVTLKTGDTAPALSAAISFSDGSMPDFTGASATFALRDASQATVIFAAASLDTGTREVTYAWQDGDTDVAGDYEGEFVVTFADHTEGTYPADPYVAYIGVTVIPCIGSRPPMELPLILDGSWILDGTYALNGRKVPI